MTAAEDRSDELLDWYAADAAPGPGYDEFDVQERMQVLRVAREAKRRLDVEENPPTLAPAVKSLSALLDEPDAVTQYRIEGVMPSEARVMLSAQYKAGKTTTVGNLVRSLADGVPFLGQFEVNQSASRIVIVDDEMSENTTRRWLREQGIANVESVADVVSLRGRVSAFNLLDARCRRDWSARLRDLGCDYLILDCLRPVLDALGLDENREAGRFLVPFDAMLAEAGVGDATLVHHMGHSGERSRGDSRLQDWPDVTWLISRAKNSDGGDDPAGLRYFSALGRDVYVPEGQLVLEPDGRRLTLTGGSRTAVRTDAARRCIIAFLLAESKEDRKPNKSAIETAVKAAGNPLHVGREALGELARAGLVVAEDGPNNSQLHAFAYPCAKCGLPVAAKRASHESCPADVDELVLP